MPSLHPIPFPGRRTTFNPDLSRLIYYGNQGASVKREVVSFPLEFGSQDGVEKKPYCISISMTLGKD